MKIGRLRVRADAGWLLVAGVLVWTLAAGRFPRLVPGSSAATYWAGGALAAALLVASVLAHEIAHALVARLFGLRVSAVRLRVFGGVSGTDREPPHPGADALVAIAGPLTSLAAGLTVLAARHASAEGDAWAAVLGYVGLLNVAIGLFNLVPGYPLDGGRLLRALVWWWSGDRDGATTMAARSGLVFALALIALGGARLSVRDVPGAAWLALLGVLLFSAAWTTARGRVAPERGEAARALDRVA